MEQERVKVSINKKNWNKLMHVYEKYLADIKKKRDRYLLVNPERISHRNLDEKYKLDYNFIE